MAEHNRLVQLLYSDMVFDYIMSDQGFLNEVYKDNWHEIGFVNNANLALYAFKRDFWNQHKPEDINVIHFTMTKPWKCDRKGQYGPICALWIDAE
jgi:lipopolysaccharide biosynthesis glycosyltransferase